MAESELARRYQQAVQDVLGVIAKIRDNGDVAYTIPTVGHFVFDIDEKDPSYFNLIFPGFADDGDFNGDRTEMLARANSVNMKLKVAKVFLVTSREGDELNAHAVVEMYLPATDGLPTVDTISKVVERANNVIVMAVHQFREGA